jgi:hypothetical protein
MRTSRRGLLSMVVVSAALCALPLTVTLGSSTPAGAARPALAFGENSVSLQTATLGDVTAAETTITNNSGAPDAIGGSTPYSASGANPLDFGLSLGLDCPTPVGDTVTLQPGASCSIFVLFFPGALGVRSATLTLNDSLATHPSIFVSGTGTIGYYEVSSNGAVTHFGDAANYGDASSIDLNHPIVGMAQTGDDGGYWLVASDGGIFNYGDAGFFGSAGALPLNKPIVGMASTLDGGGYWLVASDGGIFDYGDAPFDGSAGSIHLNQPIVGMATTPDGGGYWMVASDGGIFSYGDAHFFGSTGSMHLNKPIVGMASTPDGGGYWLVASDGGVFAYGDAKFYGSTGSIHLNQPIVGAAAMPTGNGYWFAAADGGLFNYGDAPYYGSGSGLNLGGPVVAITTDGEPTLQGFLDEPAISQGHTVSHAGWAVILPGRRYVGP